MSDDEFRKVTEQLKDVFRTERNSQKDKLVSNISSKMETAGFVPAFLDGNFKSDYVNFRIEFLNPISSGIIITVSNKKYKLSFIVGMNSKFLQTGVPSKLNVDTVIQTTFINGTEKVDDVENLRFNQITDLGKIMNQLEAMYEKMAKMYNDALLKEIQKEVKEEKEQDKQKQTPEKQEKPEEKGEEGEEGEGEEGGEEGEKIGRAHV